MKHYLIVTICIFLVGNKTFSQKVKISASESDADILVDGKKMGTGQLEVKIPSKTCVNIKIRKPGFLRYETNYCNKSGETKPPKSEYFEMQRDDAEAASLKTDKANVDFEVETKTSASVVDKWKLVNQIVTDYFDAIEASDKETSYLRTAWSIQAFAQNTIRTRLIVKLSRSEPLTFKVKLVSEYSGDHGTSVKADEKFREWDRILRKYQNVITDFQTRLGNL